MNEPTHLDLFSGIGGFAIAAQWAGFRTVAFCEIDPYCRKVLAIKFLADTSQWQDDKRGRSELEKATGSGQGVNTSAEFSSKDVSNSHSGRRMGQERESNSNGSQHGFAAKCYSDIFDLNGRDFAGVSLITGGFPCQPFSVAGKRGGASDDRAIWPEMFRVISEARPAWVLGENVPGIIPMELDNVLSDLEGIGYATRAFVIPACAVDARHRRDRVWIVGRFIGDTAGTGLPNGAELQMARTGELQPEPQRSVGDCYQWQSEPRICRVVNGVRNRVDRLKGLGNAIVPQVAYEILREIRKLC